MHTARSEPARTTSCPGAQLQLDRLLDAARRDSGLSDFGDPWFIGPMREVIAMINAEAGLKSDNEPPVRALIGNLADRLRLVDYLKRNPEALDEEVQVAGIIIGLGRGGSTLLQRLLSSSSQLNSTPWWEVVFPLPLADERRGNPAPRAELGKQAARSINESWPEMVAMHPVDALEADEEIALFDRTPFSLMYCFYFDIPSYMPWLRKQDQRKAYEELRTWLKVFQFQQPMRRGKKWLLKSGHHLHAGAMRVVLDMYPEAKAIMTHRRLQNVIVSYCSMQRLLVQDFSLTFQAKALGPQAIEVFRHALEGLIAVRQEYPADRFIDVQYEDTVSRPLEVFRTTMTAMGVPPTLEDMQDAATWMAGHGRDTHPPHVYSAEDYGITAEAIARDFGFYHDAFLKKEA